MSQFTENLLLLEEVPDSTDLWKLKREVVYYIGNKSDENYLIVPIDFITDFASIPRIFWSIYPPYHPKWGKAAIVHDYLCKLKGRAPNKDYTSAEVHKIFLEAMDVLKNDWFNRYLIYNAVRIFGPKF